MALIGAVRAAAAKAPHVVAYTFLTEGEVEAARVTYAELDRQARGIAAAQVIVQQ